MAFATPSVLRVAAVRARWRCASLARRLCRLLVRAANRSTWRLLALAGGGPRSGGLRCAGAGRECVTGIASAGHPARRRCRGQRGRCRCRHRPLEALLDRKSPPLVVGRNLFRFGSTPDGARPAVGGGSARIRRRIGAGERGPDGCHRYDRHMDGGRVTLIATEARLVDVLAEWSRVGQTQFVGAESIGGELITLHLVDAAEAEAIHFLLGSAAGHVAAPRRAGVSGLPLRPRHHHGDARVAGESGPARSHARSAEEASPPRRRRRTSRSAPRLTRPPSCAWKSCSGCSTRAAAEAESPPPDAEPAASPVVTTPFPGIGADPGESPLPERWRREPRRR